MSEQSDRAASAVVPHRRLKLELTLEADDLREIVEALQDIASDLYIEGRTARHSVCGGVSRGWMFTLTDQGEHVTADAYKAALIDYLDETT